MRVFRCRGIIFRHRQMVIVVTTPLAYQEIYQIECFQLDIKASPKIVGQGFSRGKSMDTELASVPNRQVDRQHRCHPRSDSPIPKI